MQAKAQRDRCAEVLAAIKRHVSEHKAPPGVRDICNETGIRSISTVSDYLAKLEYRGHLVRRGSAGHHQIVAVEGCFAFCGQRVP